MGATRWKCWQDRVLRHGYGTRTAADLAAELGRSELAIFVRARHLGLRKERTHYAGTLPPAATVAYTAGLFDGEGSIQINPSSARPDGRRWWRLGVAISMVSGELLRSLRAEWGDIGGFTHWQPKNGRRPVFIWGISGSNQAAWFLRSLLPSLRLKREHAELALRFRESVGVIGGRLSPEISRVRTEIALQMRRLNERSGKAHATLIHEAA